MPLDAIDLDNFSSRTFVGNKAWHADALAHLFAVRIKEEVAPEDRATTVLNIIARLEAEFITGMKQDHEFVKTMDPRKENICARCGRFEDEH